MREPGVAEKERREMKIGILGTGDVGKTLGSKLVELGHEVRMGGREASNASAAEWVGKAGARASAGTFADAAGFGEILFNCTAGVHSLAALEAAGAAALGNKILVDVSNPLDFSKGMPPSLSVGNTDSLGEQIQRTYPAVRVVKALNTMWCGIMVNPRMLPGSHVLFMCGNDEGAKARVAELVTSFGWRADEILDLGDIAAARGTEGILPLWLRVMGAKGSGAFNFALVAAPAEGGR